MIHGTRLDQNISIDFNAMTNIHYLRSRISLAKPVLESFSRNMEQLGSVAADLEFVGSQCAQCTAAPWTQNSQWIVYAKEKSAAFERYAEHLFERCNSTMEILNKRLEFADKDEVQKQSGYLLQLTKSAVDDSVAVRVITFITLIYLSCTVVGVSEATLQWITRKSADYCKHNRQLWVCRSSILLQRLEHSKCQSTSGYMLSFQHH